MNEKYNRIQTLRYAFPRTIPVMVGYLVLGTAFGILMNVNGYGIIWSVAMSVFVYAGSLQYLGVTLLAAAVSPLSALLMALMLNARHLFYGISMLDKFRSVKKRKSYLIFALTDETFSVLCHLAPPKEVDKDLAYFYISALDHIYWVAGTALGALVGSLIAFDTEGLDFALTALFAVIFVDQWKKKEGHGPAVVGLLASAAGIWIFGAGNFIIPSMILILGILTWQYKKGKGESDDE